MPFTLTTDAARLGRTLRSPRVLLLDSDAGHADELAMQLSADEMFVVLADDATTAASRLRSGAPDLALIRAELAAGSGYAAIDDLHDAGRVTRRCPVIAFSDRAEPLDRLRALSRGCVDFLALPLFYPELHARIDLALSRLVAPAERVATIEIRGGLSINLVTRTATVHGQPVAIPNKEWELLLLLAADPDRVVTKADALQRIWGHGDTARTRTLDSHACRLRSRLREVGGDYVHTLWGVGYRLAPALLTD